MNKLSFDKNESLPVPFNGNDEASDNLRHAICKAQGNLYEEAVIEKYKFPDFSDGYLTSEFCHKQMDGEYIAYKLTLAPELLEILELEKPFLKTNEKQNLDYELAFNIGYMYRWLVLNIDVNSYQLYERIPFKAIRDYFRQNSGELDAPRAGNYFYNEYLQDFKWRVRSEEINDE